jgi:hypothetical protein
MSRHSAIAVLGLVGLLACNAARASSPDAWAEHYREVARRCLVESGLRQAKPEGDLMMFSDRIGTGLLVRGFKGESRKSTLLMCIHQHGGTKVEFGRVHDGVKLDASVLSARPAGK